MVCLSFRRISRGKDDTGSPLLNGFLDTDGEGLKSSYLFLSVMSMLASDCCPLLRDAVLLKVAF